MNRSKQGLGAAIRRAGSAWAVALLFLHAPAAAEPPRVVVTIKPIHAIVAGVMRGVGDPVLLLAKGTSPHDHAMRPSDARKLRDAELIVWVGDELESFLDKPLRALPKGAAVVELLGEREIVKHRVRSGGVWRTGAHGHGHRHGRTGDSHDHAHRRREDARRELDPHIWLDPANARTIAMVIAAKLAELDRPNAPRYIANADRVRGELTALENELRAALSPIRHLPFIVFHDSYQYFERRFGLNAVGSITLSPERKPGARRLAEMRRKILQKGARCVFSEPQFRSSLVETVVRGTEARTGVLDPIGTAVAPSPKAFAAILRGIAASLRHCLAPAI